MKTGSAAPSKEELIEEYLSEQDSLRRADADPQDSHGLLMGVACRLLQGFELGDADLYAWLVRYCGRSDKPWSDSEIRHKMDAARSTPSKYPAGWLYRKMLRDKGHLAASPGGAGKGLDEGVAREPMLEPKWKLPFDESALERYSRPDWRVDEDWFMQRSPLRPDKVQPVDFLNAIFEPGERALVFTKFTSQGQFGHVSGQASSWRLAPRPGVKPVRSALPKGGPDGVWFLANAVDGEWHSNPRALNRQTGQPVLSRRSMESVVRQRYLVMETDEKGIDKLWLNFMAQLPLPVVAIYSSGGKSWHALCRMDFPSKTHLDMFKQKHGGMFSKLGADPRAWSPTQLTRLPNCMRGDRLQKLIYLNPKPDPTGVPIGQGGNVCVG